MLRKIKDDEFDSFFSIIEASFPNDEYRDYDKQKALLKEENYSIYVMPDKGDKGLCAVITIWDFDTFAYIEHFAVSPEHRNRGLGALILSEIKELLQNRLCLEAELPQTDFAKRRINFYTRNGFFVNDYPYIQPPYSKDKNPVPLMILTTNGSIAKSEFESIKEKLYKYVYKVK